MVTKYHCHFTSDKNNFLHSWLFFSPTWAENEHWQPLVALWPLEAVKSFISCPCDTGKQPLIQMTNEWSKVLLLASKCQHFKVETSYFQSFYFWKFPPKWMWIKFLSCLTQTSLWTYFVHWSVCLFTWSTPTHSYMYQVL